MPRAPKLVTPTDLRAWRLARGFSQASAADWYGCTLRTWQRYESGERPIPAPLHRRLRLAAGRKAQ